MHRRHLAWLSLALTVPSVAAQDQVAWRRPPEPIASLVTAEPTPSVSMSPCRRYLLFTHGEGMPGLDVVARPHLKLAGQRIDPDVRGPQLGTKTTRLVLRTLADGSEREVRVPPGHLGGAQWSADGARLAITRATLQGIELWLVDPQDGKARVVPDVRLNAVLGGGVSWMPDQCMLLVRLVVPGTPPAKPAAPNGPTVQETTGKRAQVRTYQDLLQDEHDAELFEFYGKSQLAIVSGDAGSKTPPMPIGSPDLFAGVDPSPDGQYLLVSRVERPFSLLVPWRDFPRRVELWDRTGKKVRELAKQPLQETVPIGGVPTGPRGFDWVPVRPHALTWVEALDGGDPKAKVPARDVVKLLTEPDGEASEWLRTQHRFQGARYGEDGALALVSEFDRDTRRQRVWRFDAKDPAKPGAQLYERSTQDAYGDPGNPASKLTPHGQSLLRMRGSTLFRSGQGASPQGDRPFLDTWDLAGGEKKRLWQCADGRLESVVGFLDDTGQKLLISSESPSEPRNYHIVDLTSGSRQALTAFTDPALPYIQKVKKELLRYKRADGVALSGTLYLPPDYQAGQRLPVLVWAYPVEYNQADDAAQVRGSPNRYVRLSGTSHLWLLLAGYAVLDDASMPIVGPVRTANDTFVQQIIQNAEAAAKALVDHGVGDPERLAVAGHSYGAFMTANLLCHTNVFAAGIARSGAYNRTLTPFGFQREERTYWEAPEIYQTMSPFANAHKLNEPLLLIHGDDDNNPGTFPIQSQRLYHALKGHGATARLVMLPHESHGYRARESTLHCLAEMIDWLDRYVKQRPTR